MAKSGDVKEKLFALGADLCGIASADRFSEAPDGYKPADIYPDARSVIVFARRIPESVFFSGSSIPYTFAGDMVAREVFRITFEAAIVLEDMSITAVPVPSEPYDYWDRENMIGKGLLSLKHAGYLAGLGVIGRNTLLNNPQFGNLIKLGALITNASLEPDPIIRSGFCSDSCSLCINNCRSGALDSNKVIQKNCREYSEGKTAKGADIITCYNCRKVCPHRSGWEIR